MKRPLRNLTATVAADAGSRVLGFIATAYLGQTLGASAFGLMNIGLAVLSYVVVLSTLGLSMKGVRDVAAMKDGLPERTLDIIGLRVFLACAGSVTVAVVVLFASHNPQFTRVVVGFSLSAVPIACSPEWFFQGKERLDIVSGGKVLVYVVYLVGVLALVTGPAEVEYSAVAFLIANTIASFILLIAFMKTPGIRRLSIRPAEWVRLVKESVPFSAVSLLSQTILNLPVLIIAAVLSTGDAGIFGAAMKIVFFFLMLDRVLLAVLLPAATRYHRSGTVQYRYMIDLAARATFAGAIALALPAALLGEQVVSVVYGPGYESATVVWQVLLGYFVLTLLNTVLMSALMAEGREVAFVKAMALGTAVLVVLCVALTMAIGVVGAAVGMVVGEAVIAARLLHLVRQTMLLNTIRLLAPPGVAAGAALATVGLVGNAPVLLVAVCGFAVFVVVAVSLRIVSRDDMRFLMERFV